MDKHEKLPYTNNEGISDNMNVAEQQFVNYLDAKDIDGVRTCIDYAADNPNGFMAQKLETVSLRLAGRVLFSQTVVELTKIHTSRQSTLNTTTTQETEDALNVTNNEFGIFLRNHSKRWQTIVGTESVEENRITTLGSFAGYLQTASESQIEVVRNDMAAQFDPNMSSATRKYLATYGGSVTEMVWELVQMGRELVDDCIEETVNTEYLQGYEREIKAVLGNVIEMSDEGTAKFTAKNGNEEQ